MQRSDVPSPGVVSNAKGQFLCQIVPVMQARCAHCGRDITGEAGMMFALSAPYFALVHKNCAPFFDYSGKLWPHEHQMMFYSEQADADYQAHRQPSS